MMRIEKVKKIIIENIKKKKTKQEILKALSDSLCFVNNNVQERDKMKALKDFISLS